MSASTPAPATNLGAALKFTSTGTAPAKPTQLDEPGIITLSDGRKIEVAIYVKVNFVRKKVDTSKYRDEKAVLEKLINRCEGIYAATTKDSGKPKSLTVRLQRNNNTESFWKSRVLGKVFTSLKEDVINLDLKKLEFKTTGSDVTEVFDLENEELGTLETYMVQAHLEALDPVAKGIYHNPRHFTSKSKKTTTPPKDPASATIDHCIKEAGAKGNLCAALSLAKIELDKHSIEDIVEKYDFDPRLIEVIKKASTEEAGRIILAEALVHKAASAIESIDPNNPFLREDIKDPRRPCLAAIERAFAEHQKDTSDFERIPTKENKLRLYAQLMRNGNMLDLPFFLALEQPFIIVHKPTPTAPNNIMALGEAFRIPDTIENCDLDNVNILFYNSRDHYKAVILTNDEHKKAMRELIRREIDNQIDSLINRLKVKDVGADAVEREEKDAIDLFAQYPRGLEELVQKLQNLYPAKLTSEVIDRIKTEAIPHGKTEPDPGQVLFLLRQAIHN